MNKKEFLTMMEKKSEDSLKEILSKLRLEDKKIYTATLKYYNTFEEEGVGGFMIGKIGGALYYTLATEFPNIKRTQREVGDACGTTEMTVRKYYNKLMIENIGVRNMQSLKNGYFCNICDFRGSAGEVAKHFTEKHRVGPMILFEEEYNKWKKGK